MENNNRMILTRRQHLLALSSTVFAGCANDGEKPPDATIEQIKIFNHIREPVEVSLTVEKSDSLVYDQTHQIRGREGNVADNILVNESWTGTAREFVVTVSSSVGNEEYNSDEYLSEFSEQEKCISLLINIRDQNIEIFHRVDDC
jgi:hypothetical protein